LPLLPLFSRLIREAGTENFDEVALTRRIGATTGGISTSYLSDLKHAPGKVSDPDDALFYFVVRGKATKENIPELFEIFQDILLNSKITDNRKRALEILKETKIRAEASIISSGHSYAATRLSSSLSLVGYFSEMTGGLTYIRSLGDLITQAENDWEGLSQRLGRIRSAIVKKRNYVINLTADKSITSFSAPTVEKFIASLPAPKSTSLSGKPYASWNRQSLASDKNEGFSMPSQVNYVVKGASVLKPGDPVNGAYSVVTSYLSKGLLWEKVRVMGGAYGGFARFGDASGRFLFMSYRDPNLAKTLDIYDSAADYLKTSEISEEDVLQTVIGCTGDLDTPMTADQKGFASMARFLKGETLNDIQKYRDEVLRTSAKDFKDFAEKLSVMKTDGRAIVFGSEASLKQANDVLPEKLAISRAV
jgi:presequence protease